MSSNRLIICSKDSLSNPTFGFSFFFKFGTILIGLILRGSQSSIIRKTKC